MAEEPTRKCSNRGDNGHNSRTSEGKASIKLFGVKINVVSEAAAQERRRKGTPWSEVEHRAFLMGLEKLGKGKWKEISDKFVKSRDHTQVASHAQKYFMRLARIMDKRKRIRSSIFDIGLKESHSQSPRSDQASSSSAPDSSQQAGSTCGDESVAIGSSMPDFRKTAAFVQVMNFPFVWWGSFHGAAQLMAQQFHAPATTAFTPQGRC